MTTALHCVQGGVQLLVHMLHGDAAQLEAALWALQSVVSQHASNQAAAVQTGALPKLVDLLETGPDTAVAEYAADCVYWLVQVLMVFFSQHVSTCVMSFTAAVLPRLPLPLVL